MQYTCIFYPKRCFTPGTYLLTNRRLGDNFVIAIIAKYAVVLVIQDSKL